MTPDFYDLFNVDPRPEPRKVLTEWSDELVIVKVGNYSLGIEANLEILRAVIDALEFVTEAKMGAIERDQAVDDLTRICLMIEGDK